MLVLDSLTARSTLILDQNVVGLIYVKLVNLAGAAHSRIVRDIWLFVLSLVLLTFLAGGVLYVLVECQPWREGGLWP